MLSMLGGSWWLWALLVALAAWLRWRWLNRRALQLAASMPGPPTLPLIGSAYVFVRRPEEILNKLGQLLDTYGDYMKLWLGPELTVCVKDPADIRHLLTSNKINHKGPLYDRMLNLIGPGILTGGPTWRNHRKIATPSYNKKCVQQFGGVFNSEARALVRRLRARDPRDTFDVYFDAVHCTTQAVLQTLMGLPKEECSDIKRLDELVRTTQSIYDYIFTNMTHVWYQVPIIAWLTGRQRTENYYCQMIDEFTEDVVGRRRRALAGARPPEDQLGIVDRYLLCGELTHQEVKWETMSLFTTSQEAAAKICSGVLLTLALLPEWQEKVYQEITAVVGAAELVTEEHIKQLHALDMVYKETMRYLSIAAFIQRSVDEEITINHGKLTLPVGTSVIIAIHMLHRDPRHWERPMELDPARFLPENVQKRDPNAFVPFSLGPMDCLGRVFATSMIKTMVVHVARQFQLEADGRAEDLELQVAISVKFAKGYNLRVRPRARPQ